VGQDLLFGVAGAFGGCSHEKALKKDDVSILNICSFVKKWK